MQHWEHKRALQQTNNSTIAMKTSRHVAGRTHWHCSYQEYHEIDSLFSWSINQGEYYIKKWLKLNHVPLIMSLTGAQTMVLKQPASSFSSYDHLDSKYPNLQRLKVTYLGQSPMVGFTFQLPRLPHQLCRLRMINKTISLREFYFTVSKSSCRS